MFAHRRLAQDHPERREHHRLRGVAAHPRALVRAEARLVVRHLDDVPPGPSPAAPLEILDAEDGAAVADVGHVQHVADDVRDDGGRAAALCAVAEVLHDARVRLHERAAVRVEGLVGGPRAVGHRRVAIAVARQRGVVAQTLELARERRRRDRRAVLAVAPVAVEHAEEELPVVAAEARLAEEAILIDVRLLVRVAPLLAHAREGDVVERERERRRLQRLAATRVHPNRPGGVRVRRARRPPALGRHRVGRGRERDPRERERSGKGTDAFYTGGRSASGAERETARRGGGGRRGARVRRGTETGARARPISTAPRNERGRGVRVLAGGRGRRPQKGR